MSSSYDGFRLLKERSSTRTWSTPQALLQEAVLLPEYYILLELARTLPHAVLTIILIIISLLLPSFTLILRNRLINSLDFSGPKLKKLI